MPPPEVELGARRRHEHRADRPHARRARRAAARRAARRGARLRRHELDARRRAGRRPGAHPGRARRGGHALVRPRDARGAQPRRHRSRLRPAARPLAGRGRQPRARVGRRRGRDRRRRHGRRRAPARAARAGRRRAAARPRAWRPASTCSPPPTAPARSTIRSASRSSSSCCWALDLPLVLPLHPRTRARLEAAGLLERVQAGAIVLPPLGYLAFTSLLTRARAVLTDSGGVQKEAYLAGVPCVTLRDSTEWTETIDSRLERARRPRRRRRAARRSSANRRPSGPSSTATAMPPTASWRRWLPSPRDERRPRAWCSAPTRRSAAT